MILLATLLCSGALAQPPGFKATPSPTLAAAPSEVEVEVASDSPRATVQEFWKLCKASDYAGAARFLNLPEGQESQGAVVAERLKAVLDRHLVLDPEKVSPLPEGRLEDGLPPYVEELGTIPVGRGLTEPVRLVRRGEAGRPAWTFSRPTVARVNGWYDSLPDRWIRGVLPHALLKEGPLGLMAWQWLALPLLLLVSWILGRLVGGVLRKGLDRLFTKTPTEWDNRLLERLAGPINLAVALLAVFVLLPWLCLDAGAQTGVFRVLRAAAILAFYWTLWNTVDLAGTYGQTSSWAVENPSSQSLVSIAARFGKVLVVILGVLSTLGQLGYPVGSLLAGLGIGGLAVALAAQKTLEHLFGSVAIGVDKPFRVGDAVKVGEVLGTVEAVGLRSTRLRTPDRSVITIPNGRLADLQIESFAARDRWRLATTVSLPYEATVAQVREVLEGLSRVLRAQPKLWPDVVIVRLRDVSQGSLAIDVAAWFLVQEPEFLAVREEVLLQFLEVVERAGTSMAVPARTVHLSGPAGGVPASNGPSR